jgi:predicted DsbA family dithiol-disulfide isomerase
MNESNTLQIDIVSDVVCPWCYIGKRHLEAALTLLREKQSDLNVVTRWHPFQLNPDLPSEGIDRKTYLEDKFGGPTRAKEIYARVGAAGAAAGLALNFDAIEKQPNTLAAHALIELAQTKANEIDSGVAERVVEALFKAYFVDGKFIGDIDVLIEIAERCGMDGANVRATLNDAFALDRVANADASVRAQGVNGVPFFVFNQKLALSGAQPPETMFDAMTQSLHD